MDMRIKEWQKLRYTDPAVSLSEVYKIQLELSKSNLSQTIKELRSRSLKPHLELRAAAIFCYGMSCLINKKILCAKAPEQYRDYDAVAQYIDNDHLNFVPIQVKEVVPDRINPESSLNKTIENLRFYPDSNETVVVIQSNKTGEFKIVDVIVPKLNIRALWVLGCCNSDQSEWFIAGNLLEKDAKIYKFPYPR